jgi:hypothetical protein
MAIVTRLGKGSKLTTEEMDNNLLSLETDISGNVSAITSKLDKGTYTGSAKDLENAIIANVTLIASKLDKGAYTGTAKDLENAITAAVTGASGISIVPTSAAPAGTGIASFTATQAGTYTNYGGVVVAANSFAIISRSAAGVFSISQTALDLSTYAKIVDVAKKADLVVGKNLFNKETATIGFTISQTTGALTANSAYDTSDFMPIVVGQVYKSNSETRLTTYFDSNKAVVSGGSGVAITSFTTPSGVAFIRVSIQHSLLNTYQLEKGTISSIYEPYLATVKSEQIKINKASITEDKTTFLKYKTGLNKFNINDVDNVLGYVVSASTGQLSINSGYNATGYIPVTSGIAHYLSYQNAMFYFDENKLPISGVGTVNVNVQTPPTGAYYLRCSVNLSSWSNFLLKEGSSSAPFQAFESWYENDNLKVAQLKDNIILSKHIKDAEITEPKTTFFTESKNLIDYENRNIDSAFGSTNTGYDTTLYINISATVGSTLYYSNNGVGTQMRQFYFYDVNKAIVGSIYDNLSSILVPTGVVYMRIAMRKTETLPQLEVNGVTSYVPYGYTIKEKYVPSSVPKVESFEAFLPANIYVGGASVFEIYNLQIAKCVNVSNFTFKWGGTVVKLYKDKVRIDPSLFPAGTYPITLTIKDINSKIIQELTANVIITKARAALGTPYTILPIGDSGLNKPSLDETRRLLNTTSGAEFLRWVGTRNAYAGCPAFDAPYCKNEGYSGFQQGQFIQSGGYFSMEFYFTANAVSVRPVFGKQYNVPINGGGFAIFKVDEVFPVNTGTVTSITMSSVSGMNASTNFSNILTGGSITQVSSSVGDATLTFSSMVNRGGNPFWNTSTNAVDFAWYFAQNSIAEPNAFLLHLGGNNNTDIASIETLIGLIQTQMPNKRVYVNAAWHFGDIEYNVDKKKAIIDFAKNLYQMCLTKTNVFFIPIHISNDAVHNFGWIQENINPRNANFKNYIPNEIVHYQTEGYYQIADAIYGALIATI